MKKSKSKTKQPPTIPKGRKIVYDGLKGTFQATVHWDYKKTDTHAIIDLGFKGSYNSKNIITVNPQRLTTLTKNNKVPKYIDTRFFTRGEKPSVVGNDDLFGHQDDIVYLAQSMGVTVKQVYKCIVDMMRADAGRQLEDARGRDIHPTWWPLYDNIGEYKPRFDFIHEYVKSDDLANILAIQRKLQMQSEILNEDPLGENVYMPDEMYREILLRTTPENILNFCYTSPQILRVCNNPAFRKEYIAKHGPPKDQTLRDWILNLGFPHDYDIQRYRPDSKTDTMRFSYHFEAGSRHGMYTTTVDSGGWSNRTTRSIGITFHKDFKSTQFKGKNKAFSILGVMVKYTTDVEKVWKQFPRTTTDPVFKPDDPVDFDDPDEESNEEFYTKLVNEDKTIDKSLIISYNYNDLEEPENSKVGEAVLTPDNIFELKNPDIMSNAGNLLELLKGRKVLTIIDSFIAYDKFIKDATGSNFYEENFRSRPSYSQEFIVSHHQQAKKPWKTKINYENYKARY